MPSVGSQSVSHTHESFASRTQSHTHTFSGSQTASQTQTQSSYAPPSIGLSRQGTHFHILFLCLPGNIWFLMQRIQNENQ